MGILLVVNGNCVFNFLQWAEERKVKVFQKGERVVCGSKGVCVVEEITTLDIAGVDKKREYYILKPLWVGNEAGFLYDVHPSVIRFHIIRENEVQVKEILNAAKSIQKGERASLATEYTTGHLKREVL